LKAKLTSVSEILRLFDKHDPDYQSAIKADGSLDMHAIKGLAWWDGDEIVVDSPRPFTSNLDDLPESIHDLLPFEITVCRSLRVRLHSS